MFITRTLGKKKLFGLILVISFACWNKTKTMYRKNIYYPTNIQKKKNITNKDNPKTTKKISLKENLKNIKSKINYAKKKQLTELNLSNRHRLISPPTLTGALRSVILLRLLSLISTQ